MHENWTALVDGKRVEVNGYLPHPQNAGFDQEEFAEDVGQRLNRVLAINDGSRIHVHEFDEGRMVAHRDRWDPRHSGVNMLKHVAMETTFGKIAMGVALVFGVYQVARRA